MHEWQSDWENYRTAESESISDKDVRQAKLKTEKSAR